MRISLKTEGNVDGNRVFTSLFEGISVPQYRQNVGNCRCISHSPQVHIRFLGSRIDIDLEVEGDILPRLWTQATENKEVDWLPLSSLVCIESVLIDSGGILWKTRNWKATKLGTEGRTA